MKKGCLLVMFIVVAVGVFGVILAPDRKKTDSAAQVSKTPIRKEAAETQSPVTAQKKVADEKVKLDIKYFAATPKEAEKNKLTIDGKTFESINKVTLKEGAAHAPLVSIMHSSGVKNVPPDKVPLAFAELWGLSDADAKKLDDEITVRQEAARKKQEDETIAMIEAKAKRDEVIRTQFSPWDGSHDKLEKFIKENLKDPDSYKHIETRFNDKGDYLLVTSKYRAKNSYGAVVTETMTAKVDLAGKLLEIIR